MSGLVHPVTLAMMRISARLDGLRRSGKLTREVFVDAYREAQRVLRDAPESDALESVAMFAEDPSWIPSD